MVNYSAWALGNKHKSLEEKQAFLTTEKSLQPVAFSVNVSSGSGKGVYSIVQPV